VFLPLLLLIFWLGVYPQPFLRRVQPALAQSAQLVEERAILCREADARGRLSDAGGSRR
jgi:NADH:ubiquinone oxidoreductase subunit 4 (subunit M)